MELKEGVQTWRVCKDIHSISTCILRLTNGLQNLQPICKTNDRLSKSQTGLNAASAIALALVWGSLTVLIQQLAGLTSVLSSKHTNWRDIFS